MQTNIIEYKWLLESKLLFVLDRNTWNFATVCKLFVLYIYITVYKTFWEFPTQKCKYKGTMNTVPLIRGIK